jgi:hypothetical protein
MLWLALYLPRLPLEVFPSLPSPKAIVGRERIVVADRRRFGWRAAWVALAEAWAFVPTIWLCSSVTSRVSSKP